MKDPVQVRAYALAQKVLGKHEHTPEGRYILNRLRTRAQQAEKRAARPPKSTKQKEWKALRVEMDTLFSRFIRGRDTRENGLTRTGYCVTCSRHFQYADLQCGHWIRRENWGTRWNEMNCHAQCIDCNDFKGGREDDHEAAIARLHGVDAPDKLRLLATYNKRRPTADEMDLRLKGLKLKMGVDQAGEARQKDLKSENGKAGG